MTGSGSPGPTLLGVPRAAAAAALAGFSCMAAELTAVRVQAPHFGDSAYVWTNVIGVILGALALGAWLGGRLAGRPDAGRWPVRLLVPAAVLLAAVPFVAGPLGGWLLPVELPLDAAMPAIVRGSLVATALMFAPPMLLLGAIAPLLVTALALERIAVGRAAGAVSAAGTLGSLGGTFAATHWLVPSLGCRTTLVIAGAVLLAASALLVVRTRGVAAAAAVLLASSALLHQGPLRPAAPGRELLAERESRYQFLQVLREPAAPGAPERTLLVINEGLDSYHSVAVKDSALTGGAYYDWHALAPLLAGDGHRPSGLRVLSIGDAAGSLRTVYAGVHPGARVDGVDIDPACLELGAEFFRAPKAEGDLVALDGRVFVVRTPQRWHVIHVDAYAHQVYVPTHLASREFFAAVHERLEPGGVLACNIGALRPDDPVLRAIGHTVADRFGHAFAIQVPNTRNFVLVARRGKGVEPAQLAEFQFGGEQLSATDAASWRQIVAAAANPRRWHDVSRAGVLLDDDRPVLDELLMRSYVEGRDAAELVPCAGSTDPVAAELAAHEAWQNLDWAGVLKAVKTSRTPTPYLREMAGNARWSLRELDAAAAEYAAARTIGVDAETGLRLQRHLEQLEQDRIPVARAADVATRNGWLVGVVLLVAGAAVPLLYRMSRMPAAPSVSVPVAAR